MTDKELDKEIAKLFGVPFELTEEGQKLYKELTEARNRLWNNIVKFLESYNV